MSSLKYYIIIFPDKPHRFAALPLKLVLTSTNWHKTVQTITEIQNLCPQIFSHHTALATLEQM